MFLLKLVKLIFLLFYAILYIKADNSTIQFDMVNKLLKYPGWKNLIDLNFIKYYNRIYILRFLLEAPIMPSKCDQKIRALTVYLGCTYTKVLYNLFFVINRILKKCEKKIKQKNELINGCICTEELINIISTLIVPMSILMKSAIDGVDLLHNKPWVILNEHRRYYYMISPLLEEIGNILDELDKRTLSRDHISTYSWALDTMDNFFKRIFINLNKESVLYCDFVPYSTNYLWKEWLQEYKAIIEKGIKSVFFKFLTGKFNDYIKTVITEKYFELGFKFDSITEETFIPTSEEPIEPGI